MVNDALLGHIYEMIKFFTFALLSALILLDSNAVYGSDSRKDSDCDDHSNDSSSGEAKSNDEHEFDKTDSITLNVLEHQCLDHIPIDLLHLASRIPSYYSHIYTNHYSDFLRCMPGLNSDEDSETNNISQNEPSEDLERRFGMIKIDDDRSNSQDCFKDNHNTLNKNVMSKKIDRKKPTNSTNNTNAYENNNNRKNSSSNRDSLQPSNNCNVSLESQQSSNIKELRRKLRQKVEERRSNVGNKKEAKIELKLKKQELIEAKEKVSEKKQMIKELEKKQQELVKEKNKLNKEAQQLKQASKKIKCDIKEGEEERKEKEQQKEELEQELFEMKQRLQHAKEFLQQPNAPTQESPNEISQKGNDK